MQSRVAWAQQISKLGNVEIPGYQIGPYFSQHDTFSEAGLARIQRNRLRTYLKVSTAYFGHVYMTDEAASFMTNTFIDTVKAILTSCKR